LTATVGIGPREEGGFSLTVALSIAVPGVPRGEAEALVAKAHQVCPYSNATRNNIDVKLTVEWGSSSEASAYRNLGASRSYS
jgi:Ohr subfamily peroxiredoxin